MTHKPISHALLAGTTALLLITAACTSLPDPDGKPLPQITFAHIQPIPVNVANVQVTGETDTFHGDFVYSPSQAAHNYLERRFEARGMTGMLDAIVEEASVTSSVKTSDSKVGKFFDVDHQNLYVIKLKIRLEHRGEFGNILYGKAFSATRTVGISEHTSIAAREQKQLEAMETLFKEMDIHIQRAIRQDMNLGL